MSCAEFVVSCYEVAAVLNQTKGVHNDPRAMTVKALEGKLERSKRFRFTLAKDLTPRAKTVINGMLHDRMTEEQYKKPISTFDVDIVTEKVAIIPIMEEGRAALEKINKEKGLGFDDFDLDYYTNLFKVCTTHCLETTLTN